MLPPATGEGEIVLGSMTAYKGNSIPPPLEGEGDEEPKCVATIGQIGCVSGDKAEEKLKRLLKVGMKAISRHVHSHDSWGDDLSIIPIVVGCSMAIDHTAQSDFVEPEA